MSAIKGNKSEKYAAMHKQIMRTTGETGENKVRDFLDSVHGRYIGAHCNEVGKDNPDQAANLDKHVSQRWKVFAKTYNPAHFAESVDFDEGQDWDPMDELTEEEINELSKKTLGSYVKKASNSAALHHAATEKARRDRDDAYNAANRMPSELTGATWDKDGKKRITDTLSGKIGTYYRKKEDHHFDRTTRRMTGISRALDRLTKEETQLDEIAQINHEAPHGYGDRDKVNYYSDRHDDASQLANQHEAQQGNIKESDPYLSGLHGEIAKAHRSLKRKYAELCRHHMGKLADKLDEAQLNELMGKGKLPDYINQRSREIRRHGDAADRADMRGDHDAYERHYSNAMDAEWKGVRAYALHQRAKSGAALRKAKADHETNVKSTNRQNDKRQSWINRGKQKAAAAKAAHVRREEVEWH